MDITKIGHSCLLLKFSKLSVLVDPGRFSPDAADAKEVDVVLVTHEHPDHYHQATLRAVLMHNPHAEVITNSAVGTQLADAGIPFTVLEGTDTTKRHGVEIVARDAKHEEIYRDIGQVQNTTYFIGGRVFCPGDALYEPERSVEVLAVPVVAPFVRMTEVIAYLRKVAPHHVIPVHDGLLTPDAIPIFHGTLQRVLEEEKIGFTPLVAGESVSF